MVTAHLSHRGGVEVKIDGQWDILIAHPPCTYLANSGAARLFKNVRDGDFQMVNVERLKKGITARDFFMKFYYANCEKIAIENPVPSGIYVMPKESQSIQPYDFGHEYSKRTLLWLKGLPPLLPTELVRGRIVSWVSGGSKKADGTKREQSGMTFRDSFTKSKTFIGIARAMAIQWGGLS